MRIGVVGSRGTFSVISYAKKAGKICEVIIVNN